MSQRQIERKRLSKYNFPKTQAPLVERMIATGILSSSHQYDHANYDLLGVCFGGVHMGIMAALIRDFNKFRDRLAIIHEIPLATFNEALSITYQKMTNAIAMAKLGIEFQDSPKQDEKQKASKQFNEMVQKKIESFRKTLDERDQLILDILPFFNGVKLIHQTGKLHHLLPDEKTLKEKKLHKPLAQDFQLALPLIASVALETLGIEEITVDFFYDIYDKAELDIYFQCLEKTLRDEKITEPVGVSLGNSDHHVGVVYDPTLSSKNSLFFIDMPNLTLSYDISDAKTIANNVHQGFGQEKFTPIETRIYASAKQ